jgi:dephospho-CoA kinase
MTGLAHKPIIGMAGGIGSGKSWVARQMADLGGGAVFDADAVARRLLDEPQVRRQLVAWWGPQVVGPDGRVDRELVADRAFADSAERQRLESLVHPLVAAEQRRAIEQAQKSPSIRFIVLDVPLLFEAGIASECDCVVYVSADRATRLRRVAESRGWDADELARREKNQWPLDRKLDFSQHIVDNSDDEAQVKAQVRDLLPEILSTS